MSYFVIWKEYEFSGYDCYCEEFSTKDETSAFLNKKEFLEGPRQIVKVIYGAEILVTERKIKVPSVIEKTQFKISQFKI